MSLTDQNLMNFNDENFMNMLQILIVQSNDFSKNTGLNVNLFFINPKIIFSDQNYLMIKKPSDLDLVLFLLKTYQNNIPSFPNFNSSASNHNSNVSKKSNKSGRSGLFASSISFNFNPFVTEKHNLILITPVVMKNLGLIASQNILIIFDSILVSISFPNSESSQNSQGSQKPEKNSNSDSKSNSNSGLQQGFNSELQILQNLFTSIIESNGTTGTSSTDDGSYNMTWEKRGSESLNIVIKSMNYADNLIQLYKNYGDFTNFLKIMS